MSGRWSGAESEPLGVFRRERPKKKRKRMMQDDSYKRLQQSDDFDGGERRVRVNYGVAEPMSVLEMSQKLPSTRAYLQSVADTSLCSKAAKEGDDDYAQEEKKLFMEGAGRGEQEADNGSSIGYDSLNTSTAHSAKKGSRWKKVLKQHLRAVILTTFLVTCIIMFASNEEKEMEHFNSSKWYFISLNFFGPFRDTTYQPPGNDTESSFKCEEFLFVCAGQSSTTECPYDEDGCTSLQITSATDYSWVFRTIELTNDTDHFDLNFSTTSQRDEIQFQAIVHGEVLPEIYQVLLSGVILVIVYILIGFDIIHRTLAAMIGSTCVLAILSMLGKRPTLDQVVEWIDLDTICLLFGMMTMVAIFSQTGFFDFAAVKAYKLAKGRAWSLILLLCFLAAVVSAFLDNVTTILLLTPVSIRLSQVLNLDPRPVLIAEVVFSNIGGTATAIGDPPNVIIVANKLISEAGIDFAEFSLHLAIGIIFCMVTGYLMLSVMYTCCFQYVKLKNTDAPHIAELKREIAIWERTAVRLPVVSLEERAVRDALLAKAGDVRQQLQQQVNITMQSATDMWQKNLAELEQKYRITNKLLLGKSLAVLAVVILLFFLANIIPKVELELGWIALLGGLVLMVLADIHELETVLHKIEWGTLLFFAALFILMEGLNELGLLTFIGDQMVYIVKRVPRDQQLLVAMLLVVWVSAIVSSFIDNIPFTTAMIPIIVELANSPAVCLSLRPLVWALAFGACLGGNGTLIGASANVVCAGLAEQNGYPISFVQFFKIGFPIMLVTVLTASIYLLIANVAIGWNAPHCA